MKLDDKVSELKTDLDHYQFFWFLMVLSVLFILFGFIVGPTLVRTAVHLARRESIDEMAQMCKCLNVWSCHIAGVGGLVLCGVSMLWWRRAGRTKRNVQRTPSGHDSA